MSQLADLVVRLYPRWWRQRYGAEMRALIEDSGETWWTVLDLAKGALAMRLSTLSSSDWLRAAIAGGVVSTFAWALVFFASPARFTSISTIDIQSRDQATLPPADVALRAFSDKDLDNLIERLGLYSDRKRGEELLRQFRSDISVTLTEPDTGDPPVPAPPAPAPEGFHDQGSLQISFSYSDGPKSQAVAVELARLVIDENVRQPASSRYRVTGLPNHVAADSNATMALGLGVAAGVIAGLGVAILRGRVAVPPVSH